MIQEVVPIPFVHEKCKYACCSRAYIPLRLSYATALMRLPSSVTPTNPIICDIRNSEIENMQPGFIQRCVSTATTLGDLNGANSSLYFMGKNCPKHIIAQKKSSRVPYKFQQKWVQHIQQAQRNTMKNLTHKKTDLEYVLNYTSMKRWGIHELYERISAYKNTSSNNKNNVITI